MAQDVADVDVCDNWEDIIENGILDKKIEELQLKTPKLNNSYENSESFVQMRIDDDSRTPYASQVKILKRPSSDGKCPAVGGDKSPNRQPVKSLQQREAEYAEARLRILGSASSEEEQTSSSSTNSVLSSCEKIPADVIVTRLPRGPDGTNGFSHPR